VKVLSGITLVRVWDETHIAKALVEDRHGVNPFLL
jgi:hypothetical protein